MKMKSLVLPLMILGIGLLLPEIGFCSVESSLAAVQMKLVSVILPLAAVLGLVFAGFSFVGLSFAQQRPPHTFRLGQHDFLLDGKPFQIISGEMHPARIPRPYWRQRIRMAKAMGCNTIAAYVFWNYIETSKGHECCTGIATYRPHLHAPRSGDS